MCKVTPGWSRISLFGADLGVFSKILGALIEKPRISGKIGKMRHLKKIEP
jgi:hypothetical protein